MPDKGHLYKRGDTFWGRIRIDAVEHRRSLRTSDPKEARRRLKGWLLSVERASLNSPDCPTLKEVTIRWAKEVLPQAVKPAVAERYLSSMRQVVATLGDKEVDTISQTTIADYASLRSRTTTNATIRRDLTALSRLLACCVAWGIRPDNPLKVYDRSLLRERRDPIEPPNAADVAKVIAAAPTGLAQILTLLDQTGMRENEAVTLEGQDIMRGQIRLTKTKTNRPRVIDLVTPGGDARPVLADAPTIGPVFVSKLGRPYQNFASQAAILIARVAEADPTVRRFRVHDLRHGFAIRALQAGMNIYSLSRHLGHTSVKTTEIYLGYLSESEQRVVQTGAQ